MPPGAIGSLEYHVGLGLLSKLLIGKAMKDSRRKFVKGLAGAFAAAGSAGAGYAAVAQQKLESSGISEEVSKALEALQAQLDKLKAASEPVLDRVDALQAATERLDRRQRVLLSLVALSLGLDLAGLFEIAGVAVPTGVEVGVA